MTDYSSMSDFEINKRVAELWLSKPIANVIFNPCSYINHAWPIICKYGIDLIFHHPAIGKHVATTSAGAYFFADSRIEYSDENILRAAMIVFLMMNEVRNGN